MSFVGAQEMRRQHVSQSSIWYIPGLYSVSTSLLYWVAVKDLFLVTIMQKPCYLLYVQNLILQIKVLNSKPVQGLCKCCVVAWNPSVARPFFGCYSAHSKK